MLSRRAGIARPGRGATMWPLPYLVGSRERLPEWAWVYPRDGESLRCPVASLVLALDSVKGTTPARRAISASPSCQCMASAALHGTAISSATLAHISGLNLRRKGRVSIVTYNGKQQLCRGANTILYTSWDASRVRYNTRTFRIA